MGSVEAGWFWKIVLSSDKGLSVFTPLSASHWGLPWWVQWPKLALPSKEWGFHSGPGTRSLHASTKDTLAAAETRAYLPAN